MNLRQVVEDAGGKLIELGFRPIVFGPNGGCGAPTHVAGTNGGTLPCGSLLTGIPTYCAACQEWRENARGNR